MQQLLGRLLPLPPQPAPTVPAVDNIAAMARATGSQELGMGFLRWLPHPSRSLGAFGPRFQQIGLTRATAQPVGEATKESTIELTMVDTSLTAQPVGEAT